MNYRIFHFSIFVMFLVLVCQPLFAQDARIQGFVTDSSSGEPLCGANVFLEGTGIGVATDLSGKFLILNVPAGQYQLKIIYIGYAEYSTDIKLRPGQDLVIDFALTYMALEGKAIIVTAQAEGQLSAINQQLSANSIKNIVSSKQIQELPDANAAESLRRLPGINIIRVGGEGNQVVIRGLEPKFNATTIDGVRMASSDRDNRATDLSMISSTMLEGIEVSKTITADQDADVLGGSVNFKIREAAGGAVKGLAFNLLVQGGYTGLSSAENKLNNYKLVPGVEGRFFNERLGLFFQGNIERRNLTSDQYSADFVQYNAFKEDAYKTNSLYLNNTPRDKQRLNGALVLDYRLAKGKISLSNFLSSGITETLNRNEQINVVSNQHHYNLNYSKSTLSLIHNTLNIKHPLPFFPLVNADLTLSHSYSETKNPHDWTVNFFQTAANLNQFLNAANLNPEVINEAVLSDPEITRLNTVQTNDNLSRERSAIAALDFDFPVIFSKSITSIIKFGGKYKGLKRSYKAEIYGTNATITSPSARAAAMMISDEFGWTGDPNSIPLSLFLDENYDYSDFMDKDFTMHNPIDYNKAKHLISFIEDNVDVIQSTSPEAFARNNYLSVTNNYSGSEIVTAGYIMATVNLGQDLIIIPGVRYQNLKTTYSGTRGQTTSLFYSVYNHENDTTVTLNHPFWLPSVNIKYKPFYWFDVRLAYSRTISYQDFNAIIPRIDATSGAINWNNYKLKPLESANYDINFTFHENKIGLFTLGGFYKRITNFIYPWTFYVPGTEVDPYYLTNQRPNRRITYQVSTFINNPFKVNVIGFESDWQTHFWYLPDPFKGFVLNINYTHAFSKAEYPFQAYNQSSHTRVDSSYTDRLLEQPDDILNATIGYDYKDFSVRFSFTFQTNLVKSINQWEQLRGEQPTYQRWDISLKQGLVYGLQLYANINNLNNAMDKGVLQLYPDIPEDIQAYGLYAELGLRWQL
jgi:TonB-dependent receptor